MNKFTKREKDQLGLAYGNYKKNRDGDIWGAYGRHTNVFTAGAFTEDGEFILIKPSEDLKAPVELIKEWMK